MSVERRVARALFEHEWKGAPGKPPEFKWEDSASQDYWLAAARVAINAMHTDHRNIENYHGAVRD